MARYKVHAAVGPPYRRAVSGSLVRRWSEVVLHALCLPDGTSVDVAVTDDESIRALNREYRGLDEPTDVLSFPFSDRAVAALYYGDQDQQRRSGPVPLDPFPLPPDAGVPIGEIVISFPYAQRQATLRGHPIREEIALLLVHGILHLLGYDHLEPVDESRMTAKTQELLSLLT